MTIEDDGRGIDANQLRASAVAKGLLTEEDSKNLSEEKAIELIFLSGLTTSSALSDISGRGVGMDIVRNNIQHVNGTILIETMPGQGTTFQVILPLTLAIISTLLVRVSKNTFAIPIVMVAETLRLAPGDIQTIRGKPVTMLRNHVLPLVRVSDVFKLEREEVQKGYSYAVVINYGKQQVGLIVDELMGEEEVVVKSMGGFIGDIPGISSTTILGDGSIALIVDVSGLLKISEH